MNIASRCVLRSFFYKNPKRNSINIDSKKEIQSLPYVLKGILQTTEDVGEKSNISTSLPTLESDYDGSSEIELVLNAN